MSKPPRSVVRLRFFRRRWLGFANDLPLVLIEFKKPGVPARAAFDENLTHYNAEIPQLFWLNSLLIASNGTDSRVGSVTADCAEVS
jgi:type I restriction enzyme R subunit